MALAHRLEAEGFDVPLRSTPAAFIASSPSAGRACLERAADALHCRWIDAEPLGNDPYARPPRSRESLTNSFFQRRGYRRPTKLLPLAPGPRKPGADTFLNHGALELGKHAHHPKHCLTGPLSGG